MLDRIEKRGLPFTESLLELMQEGVLPQRACAPGQMLQVAWCIKVKVIWVFIFHWFELFQVKLGDVFTKMRKKNF